LLGLKPESEYTERLLPRDYRAKGATRYKAMTLGVDEFMRRFLLHTLPSGLHRIRHYGLLANGNRKTCLASARELLGQPLELPLMPEAAEATRSPPFVCWHCGAASRAVHRS
jgi:hypothetical protein